ncbi:hypothetical protein BTVI_07123 [Pitangus sulphuratus]|nr:hypothetical protein BTVI_07123 [Pitangus sulphuratus]
MAFNDHPFVSYMKPMFFSKENDTVEMRYLHVFNHYLYKTGSRSNTPLLKRDLDKLKKWAYAKLTKFNKAKGKVMHLGQANPQYQYRLGDEQTKSNPDRKDLLALLDERLDRSWQCVLAAQKANCMLGCIKNSVASRLDLIDVPAHCRKVGLEHL